MFDKPILNFVLDYMSETEQKEYLANKTIHMKALLLFLKNFSISSLFLLGIAVLLAAVLAVTVVLVLPCALAYYSGSNLWYFTYALYLLALYYFNALTNE